MNSSTQQGGAPVPSRRLRIAAIRFLNPAPLMWDFEHEPRKNHLAALYNVEWMMPSACADRLALPYGRPEAADIGLIPVASLAAIPGLRILSGSPGCAIAAKGRIRSLLLVRRASQALSAIRAVAADTSSRTTLAYTQIMSRRWSSSPVEFLPHPPDLDAMLKAADAAILIGDPALLALEDRQAREERTGEKLIYLDLAEEWTSMLGVPWISAVWAIREESIAASGRTIEEIAQDFTASRDRGLANVEALVAEWSTKMPLPADTIRAYLTSNIYYFLDEDCLEGLRIFYKLAAEIGILPPYQLEAKS